MWKNQISNDMGLGLVKLGTSTQWENDRATERMRTYLKSPGYMIRWKNRSQDSIYILLMFVF